MLSTLSGNLGTVHPSRVQTVARYLTRRMKRTKDQEEKRRRREGEEMRKDGELGIGGKREREGEKER